MHMQDPRTRFSESLDILSQDHAKIQSRVVEFEKKISDCRIGIISTKTPNLTTNEQL